VYDVRIALNDMANQLRACRARDGLTLQQLATRCGVAASTIHKIEAQQMVPTVSVLLKIARGLGRRPEELVRDRFRDVPGTDGPNPTEEGATEPGGERPFDRSVGAWRVDASRGERLDLIRLEPGQRAIVFVERGRGELSGPARRLRLGAGDCVELEDEEFTLASEPTEPVAVLLIVSPVGYLAERLGPPNAAPRPKRRPAPAAHT
jgi:transcriptional regulator with XRE-family HTH domain